MLHNGIIGWDNITHGINATGRLPKNILQHALTKMENAWPDSEVGRELAKRSINSLIGIMSIEQSSLWMVKSCLQDESQFMNGWSCKSTTEFKGGQVTDVYFQTVLESHRSMRPIHDICLHTELTRLAMAIQIIKSLGVPQRDISCFKTDSIEFF